MEPYRRAADGGMRGFGWNAVASPRLHAISPTVPAGTAAARATSSPVGDAAPARVNAPQPPALVTALSAPAPATDDHHELEPGDDRGSR
jgi:hypothetical protein